MGRWLRFSVLTVVVCLAGAGAGCGSSSDDDADGKSGAPGSGGAAGSGAVGSGGTTAGQGGGSSGSAGTAGKANGSGGSSAAGGASASGGVAGAAGGAATGNGGTGGSAAGSGGSSGSGGSAGKAGKGERPDPASATELDACLYFVRVQCNKLYNECNGEEVVDVPCATVDADCPDRYFSEGAQLSVADVIECADAWSATSCDDINHSVYPSCPDAGTKLTGDSCMFGAQCASWKCLPNDPDAPRSSCGHCGTVADEGEDCLSLGVACADGFHCDITCQPNAVKGLPPGSSCEGFYDCANGNRCLQFAGESAPTCQPLPGVNEECPSNYDVCAPGAYCCNFSTCLTGGLCLEAPPLGDPCDDVISNYQCGAGLHCDAQTLSNECTAPIQAGGSCESSRLPYEQSGCAEGTYCRCNDAACSGTLGTCVIRRDPGEACGGANVECIPGAACEGGVCVASGLQGRFAECPN